MLVYRFFESTYTHSFILFYLPSILVSALIIWRKPCSLFVLPVGFFISPLFDPIWMSLLGRRYFFLFSGGNSAMHTSLIMQVFLYALPFTFITFILAVVVRTFNDSKKDETGKNVNTPKIEKPQLVQQDKNDKVDK